VAALGESVESVVGCDAVVLSASLRVESPRLQLSMLQSMLETFFSLLALACSAGQARPHHPLLRRSYIPLAYQSTQPRFLGGEGHRQTGTQGPEGSMQQSDLVCHLSECKQGRETDDRTTPASNSQLHSSTSYLHHQSNMCVPWLNICKVPGRVNLSFFHKLCYRHPLVLARSWVLPGLLSVRAAAAQSRRRPGRIVGSQKKQRTASDR
jgi:hypothetical protein